MMRDVLTAYSNIFFLNNPLYGAIVLGLTFTVPNIGFCGLASVASVIVFTRLVNPNLRPDQYSYSLVNIILIGLFSGMVFRFDLHGAALIVAMTIATMALTFTINSIFAAYQFPVLSLPFSLVGIPILAMATQYSNLFLLGNYELPQIPHLTFAIHQLEDLGRSLAELLANPHSIVGIVLACLVLVRSRLAFAYLILGFFEGKFLESLLARPDTQFNHLSYAFNDILTAIALGTVFLVPSLQTIFITLIGVAMTVFFGDALQTLLAVFHVPVLTIPFCLSVGTMLLLLRALGYKDLVLKLGDVAERTLEQRISSVERFQLGFVQVGHPLNGQWKISQGGEGEFTHKPPWQYAIDFIGTDTQGKSYQNKGLILEDYYAFKSPVFSPVNGYVTSVVSNLSDCPAGTVDTASPWGNHIIIRTLDGYYVELSHLMKDSVLIRTGDYVYEGMQIANVGNSGYSPEPHLHIQVQVLPHVGAGSIPFRFASYIHQSILHFAKIPSEGQTIEMLPPNQQIDQTLSFVLGSRLLFRRSSKPDTIFGISIQMDALSGYFYFSDENENRLYFSKNKHFFCFFDYQGSYRSLLKALYIAAPRIPLVYKEALSWEEIIPPTLSLHPIVYWFLFPFAAFIRAPFIKKGAYSFSNRGRIMLSGKSLFHGKKAATWIELDPVKRITAFNVAGELFEFITLDPRSQALTPKPVMVS